MFERHLVMVHQPGRQALSDFEDIAARVERIAPDIAVFIANNERLMPQLRKRGATLPTLVFSPGPLARFRPGRGRIFAGRPMPRLEELAVLARAGLPIPAFAELRPDSEFPAEIFGTHVVRKPGHPFASHAYGQRLMRREAVAYRAPTDYPEQHPGRYGPMIIQRFIDTGEYAKQYRVLTLFGRPLYALSWKSSVPRAALHAPDAELGASRLTAIGHDQMELGYAYDDDVLALASRAYAAMPEVPLQGCDIIRDIHTGEIYLMEINPGGNTWHFSSGLPVVPESELRRQDQFDAFTRAAEVLAEKTRTLAE